MILELFFASITIFLLYKLSVRNYDYWKKRNVPYIKPIPFLGNIWDTITLKITFFQYLEKVYNQCETPYIGIYMLNKPVLIIKDPFINKQILEKDFKHFHNRNILSDEKCDSLLSKMLFIIHYPEWKALRLQMSSFFTKNKIRMMWQMIDNVAADMVNYIEQNTGEGFIEAKELCAKYTTDVTLACGMGIKANSFKDENAEFRNITRKVFANTPLRTLRQSLYFLTPKLVQMLRLSFLDPEVSEFLRSVFWKAIEERKNSSHKGSDIIGIIIDIMENNRNYNQTFKGDSIVAQAGIMLIAGFETSSSVMAFTLYELCVNSHIQTKLREEIKSAVLKDKELTYDSINNIEYLHKVVLETLRKYPPVPFLDRVCTAEYKLPNSDLIIEKGLSVFFPLFGLHNDPDYFSDPGRFNPDRFSDNDNLLDSIFLPFGLGPRDCIGKRLGLTFVKVGLTRILMEYEMEMSPETPVPIKLDTNSFMPASNAPLLIKFKKIH